ncbi:MAG TPA: glycosyltransferase [Actinomycetota bacterium]|nr:glycosyltransferase [Actinomycetota bacterium]
MKALHQILVGASPGDAITSSALLLRAALRGYGESEVFAWFVHPDLEHEILPAQLFEAWIEARREEPVVILHASIGAPELIESILARPGSIVLVYHNMSPPDDVEHFDRQRAENLREGRRELERICSRVQLVVADSTFNAKELEELGYPDVRVMPLPFDPTALSRATSDPEMTNRLETEIAGPLLLFVGQLMPHKRIDWLIQAFHCLVTFSIPNAHLLIVGEDRLPGFRDVLQQYLDELNLGNARIITGVTDAELATIYRKADAFITLSEHEGFCVPVLEAMTFGLPVTARAVGAVPETMAGAGLLLPQRAGPCEAAEFMRAMLDDDEVREGLKVKGARRIRSFIERDHPARMAGEIAEYFQA